LADQSFVSDEDSIVVIAIAWLLMPNFIWVVYLAADYLLSIEPVIELNLLIAYDKRLFKAFILGRSARSLSMTQFFVVVADIVFFARRVLLQLTQS